MTTMRIRLYSIMYILYKHRMGKSHGQDDSPAYIYTYWRRRFFSVLYMYINSIYRCLWRLGTRLRLMSIHAHHTAHLYRYIRFVRVLPRDCTLGFALWGEGELQLVGGTRVINGVATQSRPRSPSPLTQCAQGFSPSHACLSSRLVDVYTENGRSPYII